MFAAGEPCRLAALAGSQLYGWKGTCVGGRPGAEVGNFGNLEAGRHFWRTRETLKARPLLHPRFRLSHFRVFRGPDFLGQTTDRSGPRNVIA